MVPLGFTIGKEDRLYHIDPETAPIVQEIFRRYPSWRTEYMEDATLCSS